MQDIFGSVRKSLVFRPNPGDNSDDDVGRGGGGRFVEKIGTCLRKSRVGFGLGLGFLPKFSSPPQISPAVEDSPAIRWRKGELIGCGAFGHVYMGMNLDSGELLAVKQVLIGANNASREKAQAHIRELEEEVKLLKNLSHSNIVRYLGTTREENTLNILLEFVPGGSISSLLGKFGSFPEAVVKMYSKQLLWGLEYLHKNGIMHRDIKGANILVDNKGCIKLADFGASKQVAKLATITAAKSMKGTPYWMAPEVILQTGHSFSADIWSVGCTIIEMATGKPPWSQQFQEVAALFHIGTTKSHPPIPEHLSSEAKDFLLKCLQKEPSSRPTASDLLQHPFVTGEVQVVCSTAMGPCTNFRLGAKLCPEKLLSPMRDSLTPITRQQGSKLPHDFGSEITEKQFSGRLLWGTCNDDMCELSDEDNVGSCFNPILEPFNDWPCKLELSPKQRRDGDSLIVNGLLENTPGKVTDELSFPQGHSLYEDEDEVTETKIRDFLDEKAFDLKKLQTPLYEEFYNTLNPSNSSGFVTGDVSEDKNTASNLNILPPKPTSPPSKGLSISSSMPIDPLDASAPGNSSGIICGENIGILREIPSPKINEWGGDPTVDSDKEKNSPCNASTFSERRRKWKEELDQELERGREMRQAGVVGGKTTSVRVSISSPKNWRIERSVSHRRDRSHFAK